MRSRVAVATAVSRGLQVLAGVAMTEPHAAAVLRDSVDLGLTGAVGMIAVLLGAVGLVVGLVRHHRQAVARRDAERSRAADAANRPAHTRA